MPCGGTSSKGGESFVVSHSVDLTWDSAMPHDAIGRRLAAADDGAVGQNDGAASMVHRAGDLSARCGGTAHAPGDDACDTRHEVTVELSSTSRCDRIGQSALSTQVEGQGHPVRVPPPRCPSSHLYDSERLYSARWMRFQTRP
jgi:hypothetical protein